MKSKKWVLPVCIIAAVVSLCIIVPLSIAGASQEERSDPPACTASSVAETDGSTKDHEPTDHGEEKAPGSFSVAFDAQYIRTHGYEDAKYPAVRIIRSVRELNAYYEANKEKYDLERKETVYSDTTIGFLDACDKYDDAYFEEHILLMVLLEEGSGGTRHKVRSVTVDPDGQCEIYIDTVKQGETDDMGEWHILIEPEAGFEIGGESDVTVYLDGVDPLKRSALVRHGLGFANISLTILNGWEYDVEDHTDTDEFYISFWPAGMSEGKIKVRYLKSFGVCGTGLKEEKIALGGYEAYKGTYDGGKVWDFICFIGTPGTYVVLNEGANLWWDTYGDEAMQILHTVVVADGFISEAEVIDIAKQEATVEYDQIQASYDSKNGLWTVLLCREGRTGGEQTVTVTCEGKVVDNQYGSLDGFSFSLTWGCYGISSYDSTTGRLVKTTDATHPEDYVTTYRLTEEQLQQIYDWIEGLQVTGYPDVYDPQEGKLFSDPSMTLILSVQTDTVRKTIRASDIALTYQADNAKGRKFLDVCNAIRTLLTETEEWKALPEYEFFYD